MRDSHVALYETIRKRITTTMIGALASIEEHLDLDEEQYAELRQEILDKGNAQIRELRRDLEHYDIHHKKVYFVPLRRENGH
jgi:vacuolar-type H+-ATPase subunit H